MNKKILSIVLGLLILVLASCSQQINNADSKVDLITSFSVEYHSKLTSAAGTRNLDINYQVKDNKIISCLGIYSFPAPRDRLGETDTEKCSVEKLLKANYNVPLHLITTYDETNLSGEIQEGPTSYNWTVKK